MFHDLDVRVQPYHRRAAARTFQRLGYEVIAFTTTIRDKNKITADDLPKRQNYDVDDVAGNTDGTSQTKRRRKGIKVLERVTIVIDDVSQVGILNSPELTKFDIVACSPTSEKLLLQCLQFDFDVLCLPIDQRSLFQLKRPHIHVALEKGMKFEVSYALALRETQNLRNLISNACNIVRTTKGKHMIMSSSAQSLMEIRAPLDVINLAILMEIDQECARDALTKNPADVMTHGDVRARVFQGIVRIKSVDSAPASGDTTKKEQNKTKKEGNKTKKEQKKNNVSATAAADVITLDDD